MLTTATNPTPQDCKQRSNGYRATVHTTRFIPNTKQDSRAPIAHCCVLDAWRCQRDFTLETAWFWSRVLSKQTAASHGICQSRLWRFPAKQWYDGAGGRKPQLPYRIKCELPTTVLHHNRHKFEDRLWQSLIVVYGSTTGCLSTRTPAALGPGVDAICCASSTALFDEDLWF